MAHHFSQPRPWAAPEPGESGCGAIRRGRQETMHMAFIQSFCRRAVPALVFVSAIAAYGAETGALRVGAARIDITPPADALPIPYTSIRDHIYVRAIVLDNSATRAVLLGVDLIGIDEDLWSDASKQISQELQCPTENIALSATHSHSTPYPDWGGPNAPPDPNLPSFRAKLKAGIIAAVREAKSKLQPARMGFATGATYLNVNRDAIHPETRLWYQGPNLDGPSDKTVAVIEFETPSGEPIAVYVNYAMHAINFYMLGILSADFPGATSRYVEQTYDDKVVAIWSSGAAGDQNPLYLRPHYGARAAAGRLGNDQTGKAMIAGQPQDANAQRALDILNGWVDAMGRVMGEEVLRVMGTTKRTSSEVRIWAGRTTLSCPGRDRTNTGREGAPGTYVDGEPVQIRVGLLTIGTTALAMVNAEVYNSIAQRLRKESPFTNTVVVTLADGAANSGYIPSDDAYGHNTFQVLGSRLKPGCAEHGIVSSELDLMRDSMK
jgi:neutral ceramidase